MPRTNSTITHDDVYNVYECLYTHTHTHTHTYTCLQDGVLSKEEQAQMKAAMRGAADHPGLDQITAKLNKLEATFHNVMQYLQKNQAHQQRRYYYLYCDWMSSVCVCAQNVWHQLLPFQFSPFYTIVKLFLKNHLCMTLCVLPHTHTHPLIVSAKDATIALHDITVTNVTFDYAENVITNEVPHEKKITTNINQCQSMRSFITKRTILVLLLLLLSFPHTLYTHDH